MSDVDATRADLGALREFATSRAGVEAFVEPATSSTQMTVLLVASDGEWTRKRVSSAKAATAFARKQGIPLYDANRVGYPDRMRQYNERIRRPAGSADASSRATPGSGASGATRPGSARSTASSSGGTSSGAPRSSATSPPAAPKGLSPSQRKALTVLELAADLEVGTDPGPEDLAKVFRQARARAHPDRRDGDRGLWDTVEQAAKVLGLH